jgi:uncharacterized Fe-S cluster protein YjdI
MDGSDEVTGGGITTVEGLREHLQWAIELEHSTIPPYLYALYSLDETRNADAAEVLRSVYLEEMLHLTLAANLLNAVGGRPALDTPAMLPPSPRRLPHHEPPVELPLLPFGRDALELFLQVEQPSAPCAPPQSDRYETIGQFYEAIRVGLLHLHARLGADALFSGDPARQVRDTGLRGGHGQLVEVHDLDSALAALLLIVEQGEGLAHVEVWDGDRDMFHPERDEVGHYYRFQQLVAGRRFRRGDTPVSGATGEPLQLDWDAVHPLRPEPRLADHGPDSASRSAQRDVSIAYCTVLRLLDDAFNGHPDRIDQAIAAMFALRPRVESLMRFPTPDGRGVCGPTFEYVVPHERTRSDRNAATRTYVGTGITIYWDGDRCIHAERCTSGGPAVFNRGARPWVHPDGASPDEIAAVIDTCPSGALSYTRTDGARNGRRGRAAGEDPARSIAPDPERSLYTGAGIPPEAPVTISPRADGPLVIEGPVVLTHPDGSTEPAGRLRLCRCGHSGSKPHCDGTHARVGFRAPGAGGP